MRQLILLATIIISGCANTDVHLFGRYLNKEEISKVKSALESEGFVVETNKHYFPSAITSNSLIYASNADIKRVNQVVSIVSNLNDDIDFHWQVKKGNHSYSKENMGLYLLPKDSNLKNSVFVADLVNQYKESGCSKYSILTLSKDLTYKLSFSSDSFELHENAYVTYEGSWSLVNNIIVLIDNTMGEKLIFKIERTVKPMLPYLSHDTNLIVTKNDTNFTSCNYTHSIMSLAETD